MKGISFYLIGMLGLGMAFSGCNAIKPAYGPDAKDWEQNELPDKPVEKTVYMAGDMGNVPEMKDGAVHQILKDELRTNKNSSIVFLGDNIYPSGLPVKKGREERKEAEAKLNTSLQLLKGHQGEAYFIAGNHDWRTGLEGIKAQEQYIEQYPGINADFLPDDGCPGPQAVELSDELLLITIDSEQWLTENEFNTDCSPISRELMLSRTEAIISENEGKNIILALHHPVFSDGPHGGNFPVSDHFFPLTNLVNGLYLPMPGLGTLYTLLRGSGVSHQDIVHEDYQDLKEGLLEMVKRRPRVIFASGHEHNQQYLKEEGNHFLVSGSGSKKNYVKKNGQARFAHAENGYMKLTHYEDGALWLEAMVPRENGASQEVVFRKQLLDPTPPAEFMDIPDDSTATVVAGAQYAAGGFKRFFWGDHYRDVWTTPIEVPVVDLGGKKGGLELIEKGGGQQTKSLKLKGADGKLYTFRSIDKDPSKALPPGLENTVADDIVQDQISASIPWGAFSLQYMQEAAGIYHTNPELVVIPDDPALGRFRPMFGGMLAMFEEDVDESWESTGKFGNTENAVGTETMLEDLEDDSDNRVDQAAYLRLRLFDMLVGDWDRHGGQLRWAEFETEDDRDLLFRPVPEDRDNVFFKFDGVIPWLASRKWGLRNFRNFNADFKDIKGLNLSGRHLDKRALTEMKLEDWLAIADTLQRRLDKANMKSALKKAFPDTAYSIAGETILNKLVSRKSKLKKVARTYYKVLAEEVNIWGSHNSEFFEVKRLNADSTRVRMYNSNDEGEKGFLLYERMFKTDETDEIRLYALGDRDYIHVTGQVSDGITVRVIGGAGKDVFVDRSQVNGLKKHTRYYDNKQYLNKELRGIKIRKEANEVQDGPETRLMTEDDPAVNEYEADRQSFEYEDVLTPIVNVGFNADDGLVLGGGVSFKTHGFRKEPYETLHRIEGAFAFEFEGYNFRYQGDYTSLIGDMDLNVDLKAFAPNFETNFYGFGNNTELTDHSEDFHRVTYDQYTAHPALVNELGELSEFTVGPEYQYIDVESNEDRFISEEQQGVTTETFEPRQFAGLKVQFQFSTLEEGTHMPENGFYWEAWGKSLFGLDKYSEDFSRFGSEIRAYYTFDPLSATLALRAGGATNTGEFEFFHGNTLGGENDLRGEGNLRGFRRDRFNGRSSFYQNTELRIKLIDFWTVLFPGEFGIMGLNDVGRVWTDDENSKKWHHGYGGGIWFTPVKRVVLTGTYSLSVEDELFNVNVGYRF